MKVMGTLDRNYSILEQLLEQGVTSISLAELDDLGYNINISTSYHKIRGRNEYRCFDIRFYLTPSKIMCIERINLEFKPARP